MPCEWCAEILWPAVVNFLVPGVALVIATLAFALMSYATTTVSPAFAQRYSGCCGIGGPQGHSGLLIADSVCGGIWLLILILLAATAPQRWSEAEKKWFAGAISLCAVFFLLMIQSVFSIQYYRKKHPLYSGSLSPSPAALARAVCWTVVCRGCRRLCQVPVSSPEYPCPTCGHALGLHMQYNPHVVAVGQPVLGPAVRPRITTAMIRGPHSLRSPGWGRPGHNEGIVDLDDVEEDVTGGPPDRPLVLSSTDDTQELQLPNAEVFPR